MLKKVVIAIVFTFGFVFHPTLATADEVTDVVNDVAAKLVQQLPMDKKIALKSLSPDETGLPEDFLIKLSSDLEAALLSASDFEINLANRLSLQDVWQEAVEFNNADFDELFRRANADVMLMMSPRAISKGVEIAITAYSLTGDNVGKTLASSGSVLLPIDLQANLGIDVNDLNKQMAQVLAEIEKVGQTGGLISSPKTYAEFYHNSRLLQQRGEVDFAINNYIETLRLGKNKSLPFFDPLLDLVELIVAKYGESSALLFFEQKVGNLITPEMAEYLEVRFSKITSSELRYRITSNTLSPMAINYWIKSYGRSLYNDRIAQLNPNSRPYGETKFDDDYTILSAVRSLLKAINSGYFSDRFIDDIRAATFIDENRIREIETNLNRVEVSLFSSLHTYGYSNYFLDSIAYAKSRFPDHAVGWGVAKLRMEFSPSDYEAWHFSTLKRDENHLKRALILDRNLSTLMSDRLTNNNIFLDGAWCAQTRRHTLDEFWKSLIPIPKLYLDDEPYLSVFGKREFIVPPVNIFTDRMIWADVCAELRLSDNERIIGNEVPIWGLHNLVITDDVDRSKPIILTFETPKSCNVCLPLVNVDISKDGTYFWDMGAPSDTFFATTDNWYQAYQMNTNINYESCVDNGYECDQFGIDVIGNDWLYAPGIIQSSIYTRRLISVSYTNIAGDSRTIDNIYFNVSGYVSRNIDGSPSQVKDIEKVLGAASRLGYANATYGGTNVDYSFSTNYQEIKKTKLPDVWANFYQPTISRMGSGKSEHNKHETLSCSLSNDLANIANVKNFTNLRQQAGLNGRVIGKVGLGEQVRIVSPGKYLRYDRCAAACNGTNQNAIKQCIDNNDVWIEVEYNGRRGFLSRKFLE